MIPKQAIKAAKEATREVTPPPGVSKADWLSEHGSFSLIAGAIAAAAPHIHAYLLAELQKARRAAETLGGVIDKQCIDVLNVTGLHHLINDDGDGAWDVVWFRLFEMREELASLKESTIGRERLRGDKWRDLAQAMEVSRDAALAELADRDEKLAAVAVLAEAWRYKGEFGWGAWQEGHGPDPEGYILDQASTELRAAVAAANGGGE